MRRSGALSQPTTMQRGHLPLAGESGAHENR
jgi:hypothetical protein